MCKRTEPGSCTFYHVVHTLHTLDCTPLLMDGGLLHTCCVSSQSLKATWTVWMARTPKQISQQQPMMHTPRMPTLLISRMSTLPIQTKRLLMGNACQATARENKCQATAKGNVRQETAKENQCQATARGLECKARVPSNCEARGAPSDCKRERVPSDCKGEYAPSDCEGR